MTVLSIMCDGDSQSGHVKSNSRLTPEYPTMIPSSRNSPSNIDTPLTVDPRQLSSTPALSNYPSLVSTPRTHAETPHHDYFTVTPSTDAFQAIFCAQAAEQGNGLPILPPHADYDTIIRDFMYGQANLNDQYHNPSERSSAASEFRLPQPFNQQQYLRHQAAVRFSSPLSVPSLAPPAMGVPGPSNLYQAGGRTQAATPIPALPRLHPFRRESLMSSVPPPPLRRSARPRPSVDYNISSLLATRTGSQGENELNLPSPSMSSRRSSTRPSRAGNGTEETPARRRKARSDTNKPYRRGPYTCQDCDVTFTRNADLARHLKTSGAHATERPYNCSLCSKAFARPDALSRHKETCAKVRSSKNK